MKHTFRKGRVQVKQGLIMAMLAEDTADPVIGQMWFNTTQQLLKFKISDDTIIETNMQGDEPPVP